MASGVLAWAISQPFVPGIAGHTLHPNFTLGSFYGWFAHLMLGALLCGSVAAVLGYDRSGMRGAIRGVILGAILGGILCAGADALADGLSIQEIRSFGNTDIAAVASAGFKWVGRWCLFVSFGLSAAILLASGPTRDRVFRAFVAGAVATVLSFIARFVLESITAVASVSQVLNTPKPSLELLSQQHDWQSSSMAFLGEYVAIGLVLGFCFGLIEAVMKPAWIRQFYARNEWREWPVRSGITRIGSAEGIEIRVADPSLAPVHAQVQLAGKGFTLVAFAPGVLLDGAPVANSWIVPGQTIQVGSHLFQLGQGTSARRPSVPVAAIPAAAHAPAPAPAVPQIEAAPVPTVEHRLIDPFGKVVVLKDGCHLLGRDEGLTISMPWDPQASRRHAEIMIAGPSAQIRDLGSTNGTAVNGVEVKSPQPLQDGAQVRIGGSVFTYRST